MTQTVRVELAHCEAGMFVGAVLSLGGAITNQTIPLVTGLVILLINYIGRAFEESS